MSTEQQTINTILDELPDVRAIYQFGSIGTEYEKPDSDLDLAIWPVVKLEQLKRWDLAQRIARLVSRDVDLVDLLEASTVFRFEIISTSKTLYCQDETACGFFETMVYSSYLRFNEERKELLEDIQKRGSIYGR